MRILFSALRKLACLFALSLPGSLAAESANSIANRDGPAELPPAGFTGAQFVDSLGCVYIRGGQEDAVQWVARMNSSHQAICGFAPSFAPEKAPIALVPKDTAPTDGRTAATDVQPVVGNGLLVQVATFGISANAAKTKSQLAAMGFPVQARSITRAGKTYQVILLGPFADADKAKLALAAARKAGFRDAFTLRR